jgi:2-keto-3-deoxy-L-rhamnonate aldolase RhmA
MTSTTPPSSQPTLAIFSTLGVDAMELLAHPPFNSVLIDAQHGRNSTDELKHAIRAAQALAIRPMVRLPADGFWMIETLLDAGCMDLVFPMVNTPAQASRMVEACYYPPLGQRSQSTCRAHLIHGASYRKDFNQQFTLRVMIEHIDAIHALESILGIEGIDGCIIGPSDLGSSMQAVNDTTDVETLYAHALAVGKKMRKSMGIASPDMTQAQQRVAQGFDTLIVSSDRKLLIDAVTQQVRQWK